MSTLQSSLIGKLISMVDEKNKDHIEVDAKV